MFFRMLAYRRDAQSNQPARKVRQTQIDGNLLPIRRRPVVVDQSYRHLLSAGGRELVLRLRIEIAGVVALVKLA